MLWTEYARKDGDTPCAAGCIGCSDAFAKTEKGRSICKRRKETIERSFTEAKVHHGLRFARMLVICNMREQSFLTAVVQNIKRLAAAFSASFLFPPYLFTRFTIFTKSTICHNDGFVRDLSVTLMRHALRLMLCHYSIPR